MDVDDHPVTIVGSTKAKPKTEGYELPWVGHTRLFMGDRQALHVERLLFSLQPQSFKLHQQLYIVLITFRNVHDLHNGDWTSRKLVCVYYRLRSIDQPRSMTLLGTEKLWNDCKSYQKKATCPILFWL